MCRDPRDLHLLTHPFPPPPSSRLLETPPFARALDGLLARLDGVAEQRETFAANVAHELRTPLAILMIELDRLGSPDALRLKKDVAAMKRLVGQIMTMAPVEANVARPVPRAIVFLSDVDIGRAPSGESVCHYG